MNRPRSPLHIPGRNGLAVLLILVASTSACTVILHDPPVPRRAQATFLDTLSRPLGTAALEDTAAGLMIRVDLTGLTPGTHAFHFHEVGACVPPFDSAGGHFNPSGSHHGLAHSDGGHAGDLPNLHVPETGRVSVEIVWPRAHLYGEGGLLDGDGAAMVVHARADDYISDPSGHAGERIACAAILPIAPEQP